MPSRMRDDILGQPLSLAEACAWQFGEGASALESAASALGAARRIVFTGMGSSLFAAIPAASFLQARGIAAEAVETSELLHFLHPSLQPGVAVVVVSRSGESIEAVKLLSLLRARGLPVVGLTNVDGSTLARESSHPLLMSCRADRMVAVQSYSSSLAVLLLLAAAAVRDPSVTWRAAIADTCRALEAEIPNQIAASDDWIEFLSAAEAVYLLGRGPSLASCHEGALLFHEACRIPAVAMSAGQFRHGPVEVVDSRTRAIVFASQSGTRELDLALAENLRSLGAQVRVCRGDSYARGLETLLEIVPVQIAACYLAEAKGWEPGDFRHASLVTASETGFRQVT
jgi:glutamine---fructose-6-phosphate transaminase (isomerizing)